MIIFTVVASGGSYDDSWASTLCARYTREAAELQVLAHEERDARLALAMPMLKDHFTLLQKTLLKPDLEKLLEWPKGPAAQTKSNRAEHQRVMEKFHREQTVISNRNNAKMAEWELQVVGFQRAYAVTLCGLEVGDLSEIHFPVYHVSRDTASYNIEELELL